MDAVEIVGLAGVHARSVSQMESEVVVLRNHAKAIADDYWRKFKARNRQEVGKPAPERQLGKYGPVVVVNPKSGKLYIQWRDYAPKGAGPRTSAQARMGRSMSPSAKNQRDYMISQFKGARLWEEILITQAENQFKVIRELGDILHEAISRLNRTARKQLWLTKNTTSKETPEISSLEQLAKRMAEGGTINPLEIMQAPDSEQS